MTTVLLVDDQGMIRAGLRSVLELAGIEVVGEASDGAEGARLASLLRPDVVLLDLRMPCVGGAEATRRLRADPITASMRILVLTTFDGERDVLEALAAGADGFIGKSAGPDELVDAVEDTAAGASVLSPRAARAVVDHLARERLTTSSDVDDDLQRRVATLTARERSLVIAAAEGHDNSAIARALQISPLTVKTHINRAMMKLDARDRGQLVALAYRARLVQP